MVGSTLVTVGPGFMATVRRRGKKWQALVRLKGHRPVSETFHVYADARAWGKATEIAMQRGTWADPAASPDVLLAALLERYRDTVTPTKRSAANETLQIDALLREPFTKDRARDCGPEVFAKFRDRLLAEGKAAATVNHHLTIFSHVYELARLEWGYPGLVNPLLTVKRPKEPPGRVRRFRPGERTKLARAALVARNAELWDIVVLAVETAMRASEIVGLEPEHVDLERRIAHLPMTKNGEARDVPLTRRAVAVLRRRLASRRNRVFYTTREALKRAWRRLTKRAGLKDFHFHDLRHEAISRLFERGLGVAAVALISGHKDYRMLSRYTHLRAADVVGLLDKAP